LLNLTMGAIITIGAALVVTVDHAEPSEPWEFVAA
jgi:hypothetical protein